MEKAFMGENSSHIAPGQVQTANTGSLNCSPNFLLLWSTPVLDNLTAQQMHVLYLNEKKTQVWKAVTRVSGIYCKISETSWLLELVLNWKSHQLITRSLLFMVQAFCVSRNVFFEWMRLILPTLSILVFRLSESRLSFSDLAQLVFFYSLTR